MRIRDNSPIDEDRGMSLEHVHDVAETDVVADLEPSISDVGARTVMAHLPAQASEYTLRQPDDPQLGTWRRRIDRGPVMSDSLAL